MPCGKQPITKEQVADFLKSLGGTKLDVACTLKAKGIRAFPREAYVCAVAKAIEAEFPGTHPAVEPWNVLVHNPDGETFEVATTSAIKDFIQAYDRNEYPDLVVTDVGCGGSK